MSDLLQRLNEQPPSERIKSSGLRTQSDGEGMAPQFTAARITPRPDGTRTPLSSAQRRLWFLHQLGGPSGEYNMVGGIELRGQLSRDALAAAVDALLRRHEAFRSRIEQQGDEMYQVVVDAPGPSLQVCVSESGCDWQPFLKAKWREFAAQPFDLNEAALCRFSLLQRDPKHHVLLMGCHHIIADAWSMRIIAGELAQLYVAHLYQRPARLQPTLQVGDFAYWEQRPENERRYAQQLDYWREQLQGAPRAFSINPDHPRPLQPRHCGTTLTRRFGLALVAELQCFCKGHRVTPFVLLLAVLNVLLRRHTGANDIVVGTSVANRKHVELESVVGLLANTVALRVAHGTECTFARLLEQCRRTVLEAYDHQDVSFERVVEAVQKDRSLTHHPLFEVMLVLDNTPEEQIALPGLSARALDLDPGFAKFDLTFYVELTASDLVLRLQYDDALFEPETIDDLAAQFALLVEAAIHAPEADVELLPLAREQQEPEPHAAWCGHFGRDQVLHARFEAQVLRGSQRVAISCNEETITYGALNERASRLARWLIARGVTPGSKIGLCFDRGIDMIVSMLATLKAGATYVPVDPAVPERRLQFMVEDAAWKVFLTQRGVLEHAVPDAVCLQDIAQDMEHQAATPPPIVVEPGAVAYMIYTSGSTGKPKGVLVTHGNVAGLFDASAQWFDFRETDVWTMFHSFAFDFSVWEIWGALLYGGRLVIVPYLVSRSPDKFRELLMREQVTVLNQTPAAFQSLSTCDGRNDRPADLALRYVILGGEALRFATLLPWFQRYGDAWPAVLNMYGITETTVHVTCRRMRLQDCSDGRSLIGLPLQDLQCHVLDKHGRHVPVGVPGELYVSGRGVSDGYWRREGLTRERFLPNPFGPGRMYRTGDLARRTRDGDLEYLGRIDLQVQLRGFRIELGEIDSVMMAHPGVAACKTLLAADHGEPRLASYIVQKGDLDRGALEHHLRAHLPAYMIPASLNVVAALPLTLNGKLDEAALPPPVWGSSAPAAYAEPEGEAESLLAGIWARVLNVDAVGRFANFFELGGDSIRCLSVVHHAQTSGWSLQVEDLFQTQSLAELASRARRSGHVPATRRLLPFELIPAEIAQRLRTGIVDAYPLSSLQEAMLYHVERDSQQHVYHNCSSTQVEGEIDVPLLTASLETLMCHHEILRSSFDTRTYGTPLQLVHESLAVPLEAEDLRELDESQQRDCILAVEKAELAAVFDPNRAPLFRMRLLLLGPRRFQLIWSEHHAILDGWSVSQFFAELLEHYSSGGNSGRSAPTLRYCDFIASELVAIADARHAEFWRSELEGYEPAQIAPWGESDGQGEYELTRMLPAELVVELQKTSTRMKLPLKSLLMAAHVAALARLSGKSDVLTGYSCHGRPEGPDGDRMLGLFVSILPFAIDVRHKTWHQLCADVQSKEAQIFAHRAFPLAAIQAAVARPQLLLTAFNYIHFPSPSADAKAAFKLGERRQHQRNSLPLSVTFSRKQGARDEISLSIEFDPSQYGRAQAEHMFGYYVAGLQSLIGLRAENLEHYRSDLVAADAALIAQSGASTGRAMQESLDRRFEARVSASPRAVALICGERSITYDDLNRRANRVARHLLSIGLRAGERVIVALERSVELVIAQLAVLKAGAVYVPLDLAMPLGRQIFVAENSRARLMLAVRGSSLNPSLSLSRIDIDDPAIAACDDSNLPTRRSERRAAYVMYTSGSTGEPKGVVVEHHSIVRLVIDNGYAQIEVGDRVALAANPAFDASTFELWGALLNGACVVVIEQQVLLDPQRFVATLQAQRVTVLWLTVWIYNRYVSVLADVAPQLRYLIVGGDTLDASVIAQTLSSGRPRNLLNGYGPTETTTFAMTHAIVDVSQQARGIPLGKPIASARVYILDDDQRRVPVGAPGEIYIGGEGVAHGYLDRPRLTGERFVPDPFAGVPGARMYKSGDLGRWLADGAVEFLGRKDHQVKIRGFRVELGEIEAQLRRMPQVGDVVVIVHEDDQGEKRLIAYVTQGQQQLDVEELRAQLRKVLPEYMLPGAVIVLEHLPLTASGKLNRAALPVPAALAYGSHIYQPPQGDMEEMLARIWQQVLRPERVGRHDHFFDLGGNSLSGTRMIERVRLRLGMGVPLSLLFQSPVLAELAERLSSLVAEAADSRDSRGLTEPDYEEGIL